MWMKKDMMSIYTTMPKEHVAPLATTTILVMILRFALVVGVILPKLVVKPLDLSMGI